MTQPIAALVLLATLAAVPSRAQPVRPAPARPQSAAASPAATTAAPAATPATPVPATPQQTTASFADWTLRCTRAVGAPPQCEIVQGIQREDRTVAQIAIGRPAHGTPMLLTVLVPPNVGFSAPPTLAAAREADGPVLDLAWRRCVPGGCLADGPLSEDGLRRLRAWTEPGRIGFVDALGRASALPFSPRGLPQALDALAKEDAS